MCILFSYFPQASARPGFAEGASSHLVAFISAGFTSVERRLTEQGRLRCLLADGEIVTSCCSQVPRGGGSGPVPHFPGLLVKLISI